MRLKKRRLSFNIISFVILLDLIDISDVSCTVIVNNPRNSLKNSFNVNDNVNNNSGFIANNNNNNNENNRHENQQSKIHDKHQHSSSSSKTKTIFASYKILQRRSIGFLFCLRCRELAFPSALLNE
jgi:hypothetical protein